MARTIAITGATGFIGQHIVPHLLKDEWRVRILSRRSQPTPSQSNVEFIVGSLSDSKSLDELCCGSDIVVHGAGAIKAVDYEGFFETNVTGTANLISATQNNGVKKIIHLSSLVARNPELSHYASTKKAGEDIYQSVSADQKWTILRPPAVYGPGDRETLKIFRLMKYGVALVPGAITNRTSFVHVHDICTAISACIDADATNHEIFEIHDGHNDGYDWTLICEAAKKALGHRVFPLTIPKPVMWPIAATNEQFARFSGRPAMLTLGKLRELFHSNWTVENNRLSTLTKWRPEYGLEKGFEETLTWYRDNDWL